MTAVDRLDDRRVDHQGFVPEVLTGLLATAFWMMQIGPSISTMSDYLEDWIALLLFAGSLVSLIGIVLGTKLVFPGLPRKRSYIFSLIGTPMVILSLGVLTYASVDPQNLLLTALSGGLGLCIEIGCVRLFVDLVHEMTHRHGAADQSYDDGEKGY